MDIMKKLQKIILVMMKSAANVLAKKCGKATNNVAKFVSVI